MEKQYIYRVVEIKHDDVIWTSSTFCSTKENAYKSIEVRADFYKMAGRVVEDYKGHKWDCVIVKECGIELWNVAEKVKKITNERGYEKVIGFITYEIV